MKAGVKVLWRHNITWANANGYMTLSSYCAKMAIRDEKIEDMF